MDDVRLSNAGLTLLSTFSSRRVRIRHAPHSVGIQLINSHHARFVNVARAARTLRCPRALRKQPVGPGFENAFNIHCERSAFASFTNVRLSGGRASLWHTPDAAPTSATCVRTFADVLCAPTCSTAERVVLAERDDSTRPHRRQQFAVAVMYELAQDVIHQGDGCFSGYDVKRGCGCARARRLPLEPLRGLGGTRRSDQRPLVFAAGGGDTRWGSRWSTAASLAGGFKRAMRARAIRAARAGAGLDKPQPPPPPSPPPPPPLRAAQSLRDEAASPARSSSPSRSPPCSSPLDSS